MICEDFSRVPPTPRLIELTHEARAQPLPRLPSPWLPPPPLGVACPSGGAGHGRPKPRRGATDPFATPDMVQNALDQPGLGDEAHHPHLASTPRVLRLILLYLANRAVEESRLVVVTR